MQLFSTLNRIESMLFRKEMHEWTGIQPHCWRLVLRELPPAKKKPFLRSRRKGGRPRADARLALNAILWRLRTGGTWSRLPKQFGSAVTARRRLASWSGTGRLERAWRAYLLQQSRTELGRWRDSMAACSVRKKLLWRFGLDFVWRMEFAPKLPPEIT